MSLKFAILAALSSKSQTGYDLSKRFDGSIGFFWPATHQQIYRELETLAAESLISFDTVPGQGRPDKKVAALTDEGRTSLKEWIATPCKPAPARSELLVKLFAGHLADDAVLASHIGSAALFHTQRLATYHAIENEHFRGRTLSRADRLKLVTLRRGILESESWITWCDEARRLL